MNLPAGLINQYYSISIKNNLIVGADNVSGILIKIDQQITVSDFITSKSKNIFTDNIYENLYEVEEYVISNHDIENFLK